MNHCYNISFNHCLCAYLYRALCFSIWLPVTTARYPHVSPGRTPWSTFFQGRSSGNEIPRVLFYLGMSSFLPDSWRIILPNVGFLVDRIFFSFSTSNSIAFWSPKFVMKNLLTILLKIFCIWWVASLWLLSRVSVFVFQKIDYNVSVRLSWNLLSFLEVYFMSSIKFGKFSAIIS